MSYFENKIKKKLNKLLDLKSEESLELFRDKTHLFVEISEMSPVEAAMKLELIEFVTYKGKNYPIRTLIFEEDDNCEHTIASEELSDQFDFDNMDYEADNLDQQIYFFVSPKQFLMSGKIIAEKHLDEELVLVCELGKLYDNKKFVTPF